MIIIYLFLLFPEYAEPFSHSILGKFLIILLIAIYTSYNILYGLLFCLLIIIYYYHLDTKWNPYEGFLNEYQLYSGMYSGKTDDFYKMPPNTTVYTPYQDSTSENDADFVKQNCPDGNLTKHTTGPMGDFRVPTEMAGHVFPELAYPGPPCNPCSQQCAFKVVESRIKAEDEIVLPKNSNEWFDTIMSRFIEGS
jgi:hypothetical protein